MSWHRSGVIIPPFERDTGWSLHCQMPTPLLIDKDTLRIYYTARDQNNRAQVFYADVSAADPHLILSRPTSPCLTNGKSGYFDAAGVMPTSVMKVGNEVWLYYIGWTVRQDVPYHNSIGLAVSKDGGASFERRFLGPVVGVTAKEPLFCSTADVMHTPSGWHMWYASTTEWVDIDGKQEPRYHLKHATSEDGLRWIQTGEVALDYRDDEEAAVARATVAFEDSRYHMWFCHRDLHGYRDKAGSAYRLGYAQSLDGQSWNRMQDQSIFKDAAIPGLDDVMQAYPATIKINGSSWLLYNGNGFGQTGVLIASFIPLVDAEQDPKL